MNGGHDLGGMHGLGPVNPESERDEPVFHHSWERRVFALTLATGFLGRWNLDQSRHARERQHPIDYLRNTYYENWLAGLQRLLVDSGLLTEAELQSGSCGKGFPVQEGVLTKKEVKKKLQEKSRFECHRGHARRLTGGCRTCMSGVLRDQTMVRKEGNTVSTYPAS